MKYFKEFLMPILIGCLIGFTTGHFFGYWGILISAPISALIGFNYKSINKFFGIKEE
jgi:urea transporter